MTHITNTNEVGPCDVDRDDFDYQIKGADYTVIIYFDAVEWWWRVTFESSYYGPFETETAAVNSAIESGYIDKEDVKQ